MGLSQVQHVLLLLVSLFILGALAHDFEYCKGDADDNYAKVTSVEISRTSGSSPRDRVFSIHLNATTSKTITAKRIEILCEALTIVYYSKVYDKCDISKCNSEHEIEAGTKLEWSFPNIRYFLEPNCRIFTQRVDYEAPRQLCVDIKVGSWKHSSS